MTTPKTLLELAGADLDPPKLNETCLVLIDIQNEYCAGPIALPEAQAAIAAAARLLARARESGAAIFHVAHKGRAGGLFDREAARGAIVERLTPLAAEPVIEKALPNAFAGTDLQARLAATGRKNIVLGVHDAYVRVFDRARRARSRPAHDDRGGCLRHARSSRWARRRTAGENDSRGRSGRIVGPLAIIAQSDVLT